MSPLESSEKQQIIQEFTSEVGFAKTALQNGDYKRLFEKIDRATYLLENNLRGKLPASLLEITSPLIISLNEKFSELYVYLSDQYYQLEQSESADSSEIESLKNAIAILSRYGRLSEQQKSDLETLSKRIDQFEKTQKQEGEKEDDEEEKPTVEESLDWYDRVDVVEGRIIDLNKLITGALRDRKSANIDNLLKVVGDIATSIAKLKSEARKQRAANPGKILDVATLENGLSTAQGRLDGLLVSTTETSSGPREIDVTDWPEEDHPHQMKALKKLYTDLFKKLENKDYDPRDTNDIEKLEKQINIVEGQVLGPNGIALRKYINGQEVIDFLEDEYINQNFDGRLTADGVLHLLNQRKQEFEDQELEDWSVDIDIKPEFYEFFAETNLTPPPSPPTSDPQILIDRLDRFYMQAKNLVDGLPDELSQRQKDYLESEYWQPYREKKQLLKEKKIEFEAQESLTHFKTETVLIANLLVSVPDTHVGQDLESLKDLRRKIHKEWQRLEIEGLLEHRNNDDINKDISRIDKGIKYAIKNLDEFIEILEQPKPIHEMSMEEIVDELAAEGADPFIWNEWKFQPPSRLKSLVQEFKKHAFTPITTDPQPDHPDQSPDAVAERISEAEIARLVQKVRLQLKTLDDKGIHETGKASTHRGILYEQIKERQIAKPEVLAATTYHPVWGGTVREMLRYVIHKAAIDPSRPPIRGRSGGAYVPELDYVALIGPKGRDNLDKALNDKWPGDEYKEARMFASKLFTSFDMLTVSLQEMALQTKTRGHNAALDDIDRIGLCNPLASAIHALQRYGGNADDWRAHWLAYCPDIRNFPNMGASADPEMHQKLVDKQQLVIEFKEVFYPTDAIAHSIPLPGYCESLFPDTWDMNLLHKTEVARIGNKVVDHEGNVLLVISSRTVKDSSGRVLATIRNGNVIESGTNKNLGLIGEAKVRVNGRNVSLTATPIDYDLYATAEAGWAKILKLTYGALPNPILKDMVLSTTGKGSKDALFAQWVNAAGMAKMFPGDHLKLTIAPLLTDYIFRIFAQYVGDAKARRDLWHEIIEELHNTKTSGGLSSYAAEIDQVIANMKDSSQSIPAYKGMSDAMRPGKDYRYEELLVYLRHKYMIENAGKEPPGHIWGITAKSAVLTPGELHYIEEVKRHVPPPLPANREGDLVTLKEVKPE